MMEKIFFSKIETKRIVIITIFCLIIALISIFLMSPFQNELIQFDIVDFEFSWTSERALEIMSAWGPDGLEASIMINYYDYLFMVGYGGLIWGCVMLFGRNLSKINENPKIEKITGIYAILSIITPLFDVVENISLLIMQHNPVSPVPSLPLIASLCASVKFGLLILTIVYALGCLILIIINKVKK